MGPIAPSREESMDKTGLFDLPWVVVYVLLALVVFYGASHLDQAISSLHRAF
jgi:hypothetical protein